MNISFSKISPHLDERQSRLALSYLAVIMFLTVVFSIVIYKTSSVHFERFRPMMNQQLEFSINEDRRIIFTQKKNQAKNALISDLLVLNIIALFGGALFSYYLAGRTLKPIEDAMDAQNKFIGDASHELRTPLSTLQTSNEVILNSTDNLSPEIRDLLISNIKQTDKLRQLTDSLLGVIKSEDPSTNRSKFEITNSIHESMEILAEAAKSKKLVITFPKKKQYVIGDSQSIDRVLRILIDNAIKYSHDEGKIEIYYEVNKGLVEVYIKDHGIGIPDDEIENIFRRFYRVDSSRSSQNAEGYGLGLSTAKIICDKQNIPINVTSKINKGSVFSIVLQVAK